MSYKPDEKQWMAYVYDELDEGDRRRFEEYLQHDADARTQLEKWQNLRRMMTQMGDKEVIAPPLFVGSGHPGLPAATREMWNAPYLKTIVSIAASLLLLMVAGKMIGMNVTLSDREIRLTFGDASINQPAKTADQAASLSHEEVQEMINSSLSRNNTMLQASLDETQEKLNASIRKNLALSSGKIDRLLQQAASASQQQIGAYVASIRDENMRQVKDYFQLTSAEQKKYIENLLVDFAQYLEQQRNNDLQVVYTQMKSLEQNTNVFKQETEQILSSIITTVGTPVREETKN
jgi:hypothetical protein